ncbi:hypothetical protein ABZY31_28340 [Streptomyces sp. NPDC006529]|uniref:hypothetical protein n=1 Tax=Streptomyces sp. NPDC006529 TaxID=3157177 RepID=UPI0033B5BF07
MDHLDDSTPIRLGATETGVLPDNDFEALLQATAEGAVATGRPGAGGDEALILLVGLKSVGRRDRE